MYTPCGAPGILVDKMSTGASGGFGLPKMDDNSKPKKVAESPAKPVLSLPTSLENAAVAVLISCFFVLMMSGGSAGGV